ncbi:MAG: branched-chain amino acid ABC transporter ATP-binding protein/permease [Candidatus Dormibacteria bacterium]
MTGKAFAGIMGMVFLLTWPLLPHVPYDLLNTGILAANYTIVALSLVLLIGMVGQISLSQASLVGMGAFIAAIATKKFGVHFPLTLVVGGAAGALFATLIGAVALRVRGLYLAVATLIFAYVCDQYLFAQPWLVESQAGTSIPSEVIGTKGQLPFFDLSDGHIFYYVALAVAATVLYALANLRDSKTGRAFAAVRGSEIAAASLGISVPTFKLMAFALAGAIAGIGGALTLAGSRSIGPSQFGFQASLYLLSIAVVGGLRSIGGALFSALIFAGLVGEVFFRFPRVADYLDLVSAGLLITVLLFFRGGLGAIPERLSLLWGRVEPRLTAALAVLRPRRVPGTRAEPSYLAQVGANLLGLLVPLKTAAAVVRKLLPGGRRGVDEALRPLDIVALVNRISPSTADVIPLDRSMEPRDSLSVRRLLRSAAGDDAVAGEPRADGRRTPELLAARNITVQFGGLTAVSDASLTVCAGEIVGLIGPNGAGKTTMFNSVLGLNQPTTGTVQLFGQEVTGWPVHERAALGVGRTFQQLQLFGDLTVFENLLVATHLQNPTGLFGSLFVSNGALKAERAARARVRSVLRLMELEEVADRRVAGLPFGILRLVEVARTLVTGARVVCFDEAASGLDSTEREGLIEWFRLLRQIGITLLVIEHDVEMVVRLCDYIYVLDQGKLLAEGTPAEIQRHPAVIASYLGTMEEAV